jgi:uncharacterized protein (TIGR02646 family)
MLHHEKGPAPATLADARREHRRQEREAGEPVVDPWGLPFDKAAVREALCRDQGSLCAYCGQSIRPDEGAMKIEHWAPRSLHPALSLDWENLLGVCLGQYRAEASEAAALGPRVCHCDSARGNVALHHHPRLGAPLSLPPFEVVMRGPSPRELGTHTEVALRAHAGKLRGWLSAPESPSAAEDILTLNLNALRLVQGRADVISRVSSDLARQAPREEAWIQRRLEALRRAGGQPWPSFVHVELACLLRKAKTHQGRLAADRR